MKIATPDEVKAIVTSMGNAYLAGEKHALAGAIPPGSSHGYESQHLRDAYLIGMRNQIRIMGNKD